MTTDATRAAPAFETVYREHYGYVWRILRHLGGPPAALEDLTQEVFMVVYRRLEEYREQGSMRSWLFAIARGVLGNAHRRTTRANRYLVEAACEPMDSVTSPSRGVLRHDAVDVAEAFLDTLDETQRVVFVLMEVEGLTAPEVAHATGAKLPTVYTRLRSARLKFERFVGDRSSSGPV